MGHISEPDFRTSVEFLVDENREEKLGGVLGDTAKILEYGKKDGGLYLQGVDDALNYLIENASDLDRKPLASTLESDISDDKAELIQELYEGAAVKRIPTGITPIDEMTHGGAGQGELWMIGAYTGVGKSLLAINMAHSFIENGANVLYVSLEMPKEQVRRRLLVRHALSEKFGIGGLSLTGINNNRPGDPSMTEEQVEKYMEVVEDLTSNDDYGKMTIIQTEKDARFSTIRSMANRWLSKRSIDAIIIDSLDLVSADRKRASRRDELNEVIVAAKHLAMSFNGSIPIITPWQTSRSAFNNINSELSDGQYTITAMAETSEAERRADLVLAMSRKPDSMSRIKVQTLKWRDGAPEDFELRVDYDKCYMGSKSSSREDSEVFDLYGS